MHQLILNKLGNPFILRGQQIPANFYDTEIKSLSSGLILVSNEIGKRYPATRSSVQYFDRIFTFQSNQLGNQEVVLELYLTDNPLVSPRITKYRVYVRPENKAEIICLNPQIDYISTKTIRGNNTKFTCETKITQFLQINGVEIPVTNDLEILLNQLTQLGVETGIEENIASKLEYAGLLEKRPTGHYATHELKSNVNEIKQEIQTALQNSKNLTH